MFGSPLKVISMSLSLEELWSQAENLEDSGIPDSSLAASQCSYYRCMYALKVFH